MYIDIWTPAVKLDGWPKYYWKVPAYQSDPNWRFFKNEAHSPHSVFKVRSLQLPESLLKWHKSPGVSNIPHSITRKLRAKCHLLLLLSLHTILFLWQWWMLLVCRFLGKVWTDCTRRNSHNTGSLCTEYTACFSGHSHAGPACLSADSILVRKTETP